MMLTKKSVLLLFMLLILTFSAASQDDIDICLTLVERALETVDDNCTGLDRNQVCYGMNRVDVVFWETRDDLTFSAPADRVSLLDVQTIATSPLDTVRDQWGIAVLNVQVNAPGILPGQAVTFLLMGDVELENAVTPADAAEPVTPLPATVNASANLRSQPTTNANITGSAAAGDELLLIGINDAGDWYEVAQDSGSAWIWGPLVEVTDPSTLPVTGGAQVAPRYGAMQAVYFSTGIGQSTCNQAPNALVIQNPTGVPVTLRINDLNVSLGSTVIFTMTDVPDGDQRVLVATLVEGGIHATSESIDVQTSEPGGTFAVTLNAEGLVDADSEVIDVDTESASPAVEYACQNADQSGMLTNALADGCDADIASVNASVSDSSESQPAVNALADVGPGDPCAVAAINGANLRGGPGTDYHLQGQLGAGEVSHPDGYVTGGDGYRWWRLGDGSWIRGDLTDSAGACGGVPVVDNPPDPPVQPAQSDTTNTNNATSYGMYWIHPRTCEPVSTGDPVHVGQPVMFAAGCCGGATVEEQQERQNAAGSPWLTLDGAGLNGYITGIFNSGPWFTNDIRYEWTATAGTHTITGGWGSDVNTCTFNVVD